MGSQSSLREANRARVVDAVKRHGGLTQVELTGATGLSPATVSTIVKELVGGGLVEVRNTIRSGRRAQLVTLAHRVGLVAGVLVGVRHLAVAVADVSHEVLAEQVLPLPAEHRADTSLDRAALLLVDLLERVGAGLDEVLGIGVGIPAPVDASSGQVTVRGILRGWDGVPVAQVLSKRLARPVFVDNDANLGALAESTVGAAREAHDAVYVRAGHGVGAGIVLGGRVHRGVAGTAGEIGHVQVDPAGNICACGSRGCLDTVVGDRALLEPLRSSHGNLTLRDVVRLANDDDPGCREIVADAGRVTGGVVASLATAFNPEIVVVGGALAQTGDVFLSPLREALRRRTLLAAITPLDVVPAGLGTRSELEGALALALAHTDVFEPKDDAVAQPRVREEGQ
ncbi:ROK family transcriptional regulator [Isoptericola sp. NEAU-Y5]|uniref:ROK family transcriptional regulator n=1 Tax=Isoptericola luteus TaxID=2879484 RepID=A0ABS7ZBX1_9MICO|nr:ROK family transcriptional regulator [Isoptericola sp. NEAU-Y5]MCA5892544.1 ROK family transcriptional regulator [Isoptericola sp. NEAU-Y5]